MDNVNAVLILLTIEEYSLIKTNTIITPKEEVKQPEKQSYSCFGNRKKSTQLPKLNLLPINSQSEEDIRIMNFKKEVKIKLQSFGIPNELKPGNYIMVVNEKIQSCINNHSKVNF